MFINSQILGQAYECPALPALPEGDPTPLVQGGGTGSGDGNGTGAPGAAQGADLSYDGQGDATDLAAFLQLSYDQSFAADLNNDGVVDAADAAQFFAAWSNGGGQ